MSTPMAKRNLERFPLDRPLVYIAAPYTNPDPVENTHRAIRRADELAHVCTPYVPHQSLLWQLVCPHPVAYWYEYDLALLARCDALLRLRGESEGADAEVVFAEERGIPVFEDTMALIAWCREREKEAGAA